MRHGAPHDCQNKSNRRIMSNKGAIKRTVESKNLSKSQTLQKIKACSSSQGVTELDERTEKRDRKRELQIIDARVSSDRKTRDSGDRKTKAGEPKIIDTRASGDKRLKTGSSVASKSVLPDKNPLKLKQLKQNGLSSTKSSFEESPRSSGTTKKTVLSRTKSESVTRASSDDKAKSSVRKSIKEKVQAQYNEKRGISSVYVPQDAASKLNSMIKASETRRSKDKALTSKSSEKSLARCSSRERKRSRTLSPSEVKVLHSKVNNKNSKSLKNAQEVETAVKDDSDNECIYEDDFGDYESDFEEYSHASQISEETDHSVLISLDMEPIVLHTKEKKRTINSADVRKVEEERMLYSGHYELAEVKKRAAVVESLMATRIKTPPPLPELKQPINHSYREEKQSENKSLPSSTDEGFEDARSGDFVKSPPVSQLTLMNLEKSKPEKVVEETPKVLTRGQILMNMIKLDKVEWSLYESKPISYDEFIRSYGKLNTQQVSTQTNEDNIDVEIQTDHSDVENKWTQFPVKCRSKLNTVEDVRLFKIEHIGVGSDNFDNVSLASASYDVLRLNEFLSRVGKVMLALLEEREFGGTVLQNETHEFPFSERFIKLSVSSISFLCGRQVTMLHYSENNNKILMSIHAAANEKMESSSSQDYIMDCCIGCIWNINEPSRPMKLFYSQSPITACCFHCTNNNIVFAGLQDGSLCIWDLREEETWHQKIVDKVNEVDWIIRSPTYTTAGNWEIKAHISPVVAIRILSKMRQDETDNLNEKFVSIQITSLDEDGHLIIWSVLRNLSLNSDDLGLTHWGKVKLVKSQEVPLFIKKNEMNNMKKQFVDMNVDNVDSNNLYLATNDTNILYVNCIGGRNNIPYYKINEMDSCGGTTCIEVCPFKQSYFFAGCNDGSIRLHSLNIETTLLKLKDEDSSAAIKSIQWSKSKPLTIYVLDDHSRIVVWDLSNSDIYPTHTVCTKSWGYVKCMRLSPCNTNRNMLNQYIALGTDTGNVEVHKLKKNFYYSQQNDFMQEMNTFLRYVSIL